MGFSIRSFVLIYQTALAGILLWSSLLLSAPAYAWKMEAGTFTLPTTSSSTTWVPVSFQQSYSVAPVVSVIMSNAGPNASDVRIRNVTTTGFEALQVEPWSEDGPHTTVTVMYVAVEPGAHTLPDGTILEAGTVSTKEIQFQTSNADKPKDAGWTKVKLASKFAKEPVVLADLQTANNESGAVPGKPSDPWFTVAVDSVKKKDFQLAIERSEVYDSRYWWFGWWYIYNTPAAPETIGYIAWEAGKSNNLKSITNLTVLWQSIRAASAVKGWNDGCSTVGFGTSYAGTPIVVATKNSRNEADGGWFRFCSQSSSAIGLTIDEDDAIDSERNHVAEDAGILVFSGSFAYDSNYTPAPPDPFMIEAGEFTVDSSAFKTVTFQQVYPNPPAVFFLVDTTNPDASNVRIRNVTRTGFEVIQVEPPTRTTDNPDPVVTVHYVAATYGQHTFPDGTKVEVANIPMTRYQTKLLGGSGWLAAGFSAGFTSTPAVLANVQTMNNEPAHVPGTDSLPWLSAAVRNVTSSGMQIALERAEVKGGSVSVAEDVAYLAVEHGTIADFYDIAGQLVQAEAQRSPDTLTGWGTCRTISFLQSYTSAPLVVGEKNTRDGGDGGWLRRCSVSTTGVRLSIDEDTNNDTERNHTTERAGLMVFSRTFAADFSLVANYTLDGPSWNGTPGEVLDGSGHNLHGTAIGGAKSAPAKVCYGATLNPSNSGTDYIEVPDNTLLDIDEELTVAAWIKIDSIPASDLKTIVSKDENYEFHIDSGGRVFWWWQNSGGATRSFTSASVVAPGTWTHVAIVYSLRNGRQSIYINGVEDAFRTYGGETLLLNSDPFQIGADQGYAGREFNGQIDEVRVYSRPLDALALQAVMNVTRPCAAVLDHFDVTVSPSASTCVPTAVTVTARDPGNNILTSYAGTINLTTSSAHGDWSVTTGNGTLSPNPDTDDNGAASYTFDAADNGVVTLALANSHADQLTVAVNDASAGVSATSSPITFLDNAFVIDSTDSLGYDFVAGRDHALSATLWRKDPSTGVCAIATGYSGTYSLKAWLTRDGADPGGAAPAVTAASTATLPNAVPGSNNLSVAFNNGVGALTLQTTDVGKYTLNLRDDTSGFVQDAAGNPLTIDSTATSSPWVVRPFGLHVEAAGNPAAGSATGPVFTQAGTGFTLNVRAVQYQSADDADGDGQPDSGANLADNAATAGFGQENPAETVTLSSTLVAPAGGNDPGLTGTLVLSAFTSGTATGTYSYGEVGIIDISAALTDSDYLGSGKTLTSSTGNVGRFIPADFSLSISQPGSLDSACTAAGTSYIGQAIPWANVPIVTITARNASGATTQNYTGAFARLVAGDVSVTAPASDSTNGLSVTATLNTGALSGSNGVFQYSFSALDTFIYDKVLTAKVAPFVADLRPQLTAVTDSDGVSATGMPLSLTPAGSTVYWGRMKLENAFGPETLALDVPFSIQYWDGSQYLVHAGDNCTTYDVNDATYSLSLTPPAGLTTTASGAGTVVAGAGSLTLSAPGAGNTGTVILQWNQPDWLQDDFDGDGVLDLPSSGATFGQYRGHDRIIYWREVVQ
ncbi:DUF6701 domain-containing protein [Hahella sp. SMD15-11]|uniref:DUF6701 domain-containing protein n=1 Tax=Thermohahella caldifontis TaxID=3142973 RepID=A0AB39UUK9_9GAMM